MNALDLCATTTYDLVMVDYTMPVMTGVDLIRALRQRDD